jgi:hypothetical protein
MHWLQGFQQVQAIERQKSVGQLYKCETVKRPIKAVEIRYPQRVKNNILLIHSCYARTQNIFPNRIHSCMVLASIKSRVESGIIVFPLNRQRLIQAHTSFSVILNIHSPVRPKFLIPRSSLSTSQSRTRISVAHFR